MPSTERLRGIEAVFKVLRWTGGNFQINFEGKTTQETSTTLNTRLADGRLAPAR